MKKCVLIYNPESGKRRKKLKIELTENILNEYGYDVTFIKTLKVGDCMNIIANLDFVDLVIVAGGDGTLNEAISGNLMRENKLLISHLPIGTVTDVGKLYGFTKKITKDLNLMLNGIEKNIDVCLINNKPFIYVACFGNFTNISYDTPRRLKKKFGRFGYILYALKSIKEKIKQYNIQYEIDGIKYEGEFSFMFITNTSRVGGINNIYHDVKLDDNMFEVAFCSIKNKKELIKAFYNIKTKDINNISNIKYFRTNNLKIIFDSVPSASWCIDGEELKHNNKEFNFGVDKSNNVLIPKVNIKKLFKGDK